MDLFAASITFIFTLTAFLVIDGLVGSVLKCWLATAQEPLTVVELLDETEAIIEGLEQLHSPLAVAESDPWQMSNPVERAIATIKKESQKPEILLLIAPKKLSKTEVNKMLKADLEKACQYWGVATGTTKQMKEGLKVVAC